MISMFGTGSYAFMLLKKVDFFSRRFPCLLLVPRFLTLSTVDGFPALEMLTCFFALALFNKALKNIQVFQARENIQIVQIAGKYSNIPLILKCLG